MRHALGLSQPEFAKLFKLTTRQVAEIERGVANPTSETLQKIGRAFGFQIGFVPITSSRTEGAVPSSDSEPTFLSARSRPWSCERFEGRHRSADRVLQIR
ncbi:helix-turn-helix domain-containing protein [Bradyrhizobium sp. UFLA05-112]